MFIDERGVAEIKVWAVTAEEADQKATEWINKHVKDHE
jgi:hypothetical protein